MTVWALFDSETACVKKALPEHEVYSFGIGGGTEHTSLYLDNFKAVKIELDRYPKPDVIFASPPCETWVPLNVGTKRFYTKEKGLNFYWKEKWVEFDFTDKARERRLNGVKTALCTKDIIEHYNPKLWCIENGARSFIFDYLKDNNLHAHLNKCNYYSYGFNVLKPTIIFSNYIFNLKKEKPNKLLMIIEGTNSQRKLTQVKDLSYKSKRDMRKSYGNLSKVPLGLYQDIMQQFLNPQKTLFMEALWEVHK